MYVFWVIFLVLLKIIGNQGDPNHGLTNFKNGSGGIPLYIVSMRDAWNRHICSGCIISTKLILTSSLCSKMIYVLHGLREYEYYNSTPAMGIGVTEVTPWTRSAILYKVAKEFHSSVPRLSMPLHSNSTLPETGAVVGWCFDVERKKFVLTKIDGVNIAVSLAGKNKTFFRPFFWISTGSPLIVNDFIYGFAVKNQSINETRFNNFLRDVDDMNRVMKIHNLTRH